MANNNKKKIPAILIDFSRTPAENVTSIYPLSEASMAHTLNENWTTADVRRVNSQHGLYTDIPWICRGDSCPSSAHCPIDPAARTQFIGKNCPVEVVESFKLFAGYVLDLNILPQDFTDLQVIVDLVRLHLLLRRCDYYQKDKPIYDFKGGSVVQSKGEVTMDKVPNLGFEMAERIRKDLTKKYDSLIATRKGKLHAAAAFGKEKSDVTTLFASLKEAGKQTAKHKALKSSNATDAIDAEYAVKGNTIDGENTDDNGQDT